MRKTKLLAGALVLSGMLAVSGCAGGGNNGPVNVDADINVNINNGDDDVRNDAPADDVSENVSESAGFEYDYLYSQYYDIVAGLDDRWDMFQFIDLTVEAFPSILITSSQPDPNDDLQNYLLLTFSNAGAELNEDALRDGVAGAGGYRGSLYYVPNSGIIYEDIHYAPFNNPSVNVYLLDNGHVFLHAAGNTEPLEDYEGPEDTDHLQWFWNSGEVSQDDYERILGEETNGLSGIAFYSIEYMDKASMLSQLEALK